MNVRRIASLLRELADAIEAPEAEKTARKRPLVEVEKQPSQGAIDRVRRQLRRSGVRA
jgi:hypothetical protein